MASLEGITKYTQFNRLKTFLSFSYSHFFSVSSPLTQTQRFYFAQLLTQKNFDQWQSITPQYLQTIVDNPTFKAIINSIYIDLQTPPLPQVMARAIAQGISSKQVAYIHNLIAVPTYDQQKMAENAIQIQKQIQIIRKGTSQGMPYKKIKPNQKTQ